MGWKGKDPYEGMRPEATLGASFSQRLSVWLGTGLGLGLVAPCAPGTFGSLPGVLLAWGFAVATANRLVRAINPPRSARLYHF